MLHHQHQKKPGDKKDHLKPPVKYHDLRQDDQPQRSQEQIFHAPIQGLPPSFPWGGCISPLGGGIGGFGRNASTIVSATKSNPSSKQ